MQLQLHDIRKSFGEGENRTEVLRGISCAIAPGSLTILLGPSGSGKSTLLNIIGGIESADSGEILLDGKPLDALGDRALTRYRREHLGYVFQAYHLVPNLTVRENIEVGAYLSAHPLEVDGLLRQLGLWEHRDKLPNQLSGGQQQRTAIGRAIVKAPDILLCDEPTGALDYATSKEILQLIEDVNLRWGCTVLLVTHNAALKPMADRVIRLRDGAIRDDEQHEMRVHASELAW